ncbi:cytochrome P450 [Aquimarina sp. 2201CG1-2-11]|uniref:cytochrome P450 n=1 Tax=Aquimarina discodermiae TaxID=3231043 RepID=UPI00346284F3
MSTTNLPKVSFLKVYRNAKRILKNPLPFHRENFEKLGDVFVVRLGLKSRAVFTRDPLHAKHVLQKHHKKYDKSALQTKDLGKYIGEGLLTANGEKWLKQRRLIQPAFHKEKLEAIAATIREVIKEELLQIKPDQEIDVHPIMGDLAFNVVGKSLFSYSDDGSTISRLKEITETVQKSLIKEIRQPYKRWWFLFSGAIRNTFKQTDEARAILNKIIEERRQSEEKYDDLLDMLLEARYEDGGGMDNEQLIDEILILFIAGHETTSNALSFTLQLLAMHPEIQEKIYKNIQAIEIESLSFVEQSIKCRYVKQCIEEAMRLYPPAYFADRVTVEEDVYNNLVFPKGSMLLISFYEIHRHKDFWKNPTQFDPDRFHPDRKKEYSNCYFPFGAGPRMCIGNNFAMYEMIFTISELVKKYQITTNEKEVRINPLITLKPKNATLAFKQR